MFLTHLQLKNYRNYQELELNFNNQIIIFRGDNAQGKTNILEAIYLLALAKSHRTSKEKELVQWDHSFSVIRGSVKTNRGKTNLEIQLNSKGKKVKINNLEKRKLSEYIGSFNVVMFGPEDLTLVKGSPQHRRKFLDIEIGQVSPTYIYNLSQYQKIIQQRNNLLKDFSLEKKNKTELLEIWDSQLIDYGAKIIAKRLHFIKMLENWAKEVHAGITSIQEELTIQYKSSFALTNDQELDIKENFYQVLLKNRQQEISRGLTLFGPHRDDLLFYINSIDVQTYGSQGQQRTTALSLKLAEIELINEIVGEYPILLLDDVLSELDQTRQTQLLKTIEQKVQTIITTTSTEGINLTYLEKYSIFNVINGNVISEE